MQRKNLFLVTSPFQFLNAIEARAHFAETDATLVLLHSADSKNNSQLMQMFDAEHWEEVEIVASRIGIVTYLKAMRLLSGLRATQTAWNRIFIGEYNSHTFHTFCQNLDAKQLFNLDDGVSTIELQRQVFSKSTHSLAPDRGVKYFLKYLIKALFGLNENNHKVVKFDLYTCFDLAEHPGQTVIENRYEFLSRSIDKFEIRSNVVYFYGSSISEKGIMSFESEVALLDRVKIHFEKRGRKLLYIPHRLDSLLKLAAIRKLNIPVNPLDWTAEIEPLFSRELPGQISSFFSTALYTLGKIYRYKSIVAFRIPEQLLLSRQEAINKLYDEYERHMTIVNL